jgi:RimJ/RimL family protein N-acetyltransferase
MIFAKNPVFSHLLTLLDSPLPTDVQRLLPGLWTDFTIRPLDLTKDIPIIYEWVNQPYAIPFWQMNGTYEELFETYQRLENSPIAQTLVACLHGQLISQLDMYDPFADPIHLCYDATEGDMGIHLLMAPGKKPVKHFTTKVLYLFLQVLFQNPLIERVIGEPDELNEPANQLLQRLSFRFIQRLELPHKNANFYIMTRQEFLALSPLGFST